MVAAAGTSTESTIDPADINVDRILSGENVGHRICAGLWGVDLVVRRPSGRIQVKKAEVQAADDNGNIEKLDAKKVTKPSFIVDDPHDHEFWAKVDLTQREADIVLTRFSTNDARRGFHLVPTTKIGSMLAQLRDIRQRRLKLVQDFRDNGWHEYLNNLRQKFNGHFYLVEPKLPNRADLIEKFDVLWTLHELAPIDPANIKFENVNSADQEAIIRESAGMARNLIQQRAASIYEQVFGSLMTECEKIAAGAFETGSRKFGGVTELVNLLERAVNFKEFSTNPEIAAHATHGLELLRGIRDISEVNANEGKNSVSAAIKAAMAPLGTAIQGMMAEVAPSRARRTVEI